MPQLAQRLAQCRPRFAPQKSAKALSDGAAAQLGDDPPPLADAPQRACRTSIPRPIRGKRRKMALLRLIHSADLPDPASLIAKLSGEELSESTANHAGCSIAVDDCAGAARFPLAHRALEKSGGHQLAVQLHDQIGLVRYAPPELALKPTRPLGGDWPRDLAAALKSATGAIWNVTFSDDSGEPRCSTRRKWPRSAFAPMSLPIRTFER